MCGAPPVRRTIVPSLIKENQRGFSAANVRFVVADIVRDELPPADLLLAKDVLQHLSSADITSFMAQLPRYRHVRIVNDVLPPLDLTQPPFSLLGSRISAWQDRRTGIARVAIHLERK